MTVTMPETTDTFGNLSYTVLVAKPANLAAISVATDLTAANAKNITCHEVGDWWPSATTNKTARQRKACQTSVTQSLGTTTHEVPAFQYTYQPQEVGVASAPGNEAYEALPAGTVRYVVMRIGLDGKTTLGAGDKYRLYPLEMGPQIPGTSSEDEGGEAVINQEAAFASGYDAPIEGTVVA